MVGVEIKALIEKCNAACVQMLHGAAGLTVNHGQYEVTVEHCLLAALDMAHADIGIILKDAGCDLDRLRKELNAALETFRSGNSGRPVFSPVLQELLEAAWLVASVDLGTTRIRTGSLLLAFLRRPSFYAQGNYASLLACVNRETLQQRFAAITKDSDENTAASSDAKPLSGVREAGAERFIERFCEDFSAKARSGKLDPVFGRDAEIRQMVDILARRRKNNPILVGEPGVGKTAVMEGLALRIVEGDVPDTLRGVTLLGLDMGLLEAGASVKGEFERRLKGVLDEIKTSEEPIILFIDEAHLLVGAGGQSGGSDAANLMKPALARGEIRTCAATTWKEYKKYFEKDAALARRFQLVKLDEPSVDTTTLILRGLRESYEKNHHVLVRDDALVAAAELAGKYITGRFLPDKAVDLLDTACARVKVGLASTPAPLEDCRRSIQALQREKKALERDRDNGLPIDPARFETLDADIAAQEEEAAALLAQWEAEREAANTLIEAREALVAARKAERDRVPDAADAPDAANKAEEAEQAEPVPAPEPEREEGLPEEPEASLESAQLRLDKARAAFEALQGKDGLLSVEVTPDTVARVVSDWTGIPVGKMARDQASTVARLETLIQERIQGQDAALSAIAEGIQMGKAGLRSPSQPLGVFLLVGPSGVGKTETGLALADVLFGDERNVVTVNMSEFQEKHTVSRLVGSPPGYVGYGEGGLLTEAVRRKPYSVVLLDEVEKAHLDVMQLFYQVFDKGTLTDGEGVEVSFRNTLILLTSNLGSDIIQRMTAEGTISDTTEVGAAIRPLLSQHFQPALLARMRIVPYVSLNTEALNRITLLKLEQLKRRMFSNSGIAMNWTEAVPENIAARCTEVETGARNIDAVLSGAVLPHLAREILNRMNGETMPASVTLDVSPAGAFTVTFSED